MANVLPPPSWTRSNTSNPNRLHPDLDDAQKCLQRLSVHLSRKDTAANRLKAEMVNNMTSEIEELQQSLRHTEVKKKLLIFCVFLKEV